MAKFDEQGNYVAPSEQEAYRKGRRWLIGSIILLLIVAPLAWGASVLFSDVAGRGNAIKIKSDSVNRINKQEMFEDLWADVKAYDRQITEADASLAADPTSEHWKTVRTGLVNQCIDATAQYDAEARKYTARDFRAVDLPPEIDERDPATDCKGE